MATTEPDAEPQHAGSDRPDHLLRLLSRLASQAGLEMALRLFTSAGVISGTLVGGASYFREIVATIVPEGATDDAPRDVIAGLFTQVGDGYQNTNRDEEPTVAYIHMKDCWLYSPGQGPLEVGLWRGRLSSIDGWALGKYERTSTSDSK